MVLNATAGASPTAGIGTTLPVLKAICRDDPVALDLLDRAVQRPHGTNQHSKQDGVSHSIQDQHNKTRDRSTQHLRRLREGRPDLHAKVMAGASSRPGKAAEPGGV